MAIIAPFRGYLYNKEKISNLELVVAPPYDVINPDQQEAYYQKHPYNIIRLILGKEEPDDNERENKYTRAANFFTLWKKNNILIRVPNPAIYFYVQTFKLSSEETRTRKGVICLFKLEEFSSGVIFPHERTLSKPKVDRLNLTIACKANFNPIFSLYSDPNFTIEHKIDIWGKTTPYIDIVDDQGVSQKLWVVDDPAVINEVKSVLKDKKILIADGHHRYETALNYQKIMQEKYPNLTGKETFNYTLMYFTNMEDPGLVILPTHRLLKEIKFDLDGFLKRAQLYFDIQTIPFTLENEEQERKKVLAKMQNEARQRYLIGLIAKNSRSYFLLRLKGFELVDRIIPAQKSEALRQLDANIMEHLVFNHLLGISGSDSAWEDQVVFVHTDREAMDLIKSGKFEVAFLVNPTRIEQVKEVVAQGGIMPQKSTYFFPKLLSGLVINPLSPEETVE